MEYYSFGRLSMNQSINKPTNQLNRLDGIKQQAWNNSTITTIKYNAAGIYIHSGIIIMEDYTLENYTQNIMRMEDYQTYKQCRWNNNTRGRITCASILEHI